jgi:glycosyltransferase involved in cell wall biosynthesis
MVMHQKPYFSIVIPSLNEEKYLPTLLTDLTKQTFKDFEIILVDGASTDKTIKKAEDFKTRLNLKINTVKKQNVSFQRNYGAEKAKSDWIIFMDADNSLPEYFLDGIKYQIIKNKDMDAFTTFVAVKEKSPTAKAVEAGINAGLELSNQSKKRKTALGALLGVKKTVIRKVKFDEETVVAEDYVFATECAKKGYEFVVLKDPKFFLSMRRINKEGALKMLGNSGLNFIKMSGGKTIKNNKNYIMAGGGYYDTKKEKLDLINPDKSG